MYNPEIGFWGGMALLVSSITGPGLTTGMTGHSVVRIANNNSPARLSASWLAAVSLLLNVVVITCADRLLCSSSLAFYRALRLFS